MKPGFEIAVAGSNDTATARFWRKVRVTDGCWVWRGKPNHSGYGRFRLGGQGSPDMGAHIVSYRSLNGPGEPGTVVHHSKCRDRMCVRPDHLREMDLAEHRALHHEEVRTKPECLNGHDLTRPENVYRWRGVRHCRPCKRNRDRIALGIPPERWKIQSY